MCCRAGKKRPEQQNSNPILLIQTDRTAIKSSSYRVIQTFLSSLDMKRFSWTGASAGVKGWGGLLVPGMRRPERAGKGLRMGKGPLVDGCEVKRLWMSGREVKRLRCGWVGARLNGYGWEWSLRWMVARLNGCGWVGARLNGYGCEGGLR